MRVTGGTLRGRILAAPPGRSTRPTSDLVRGALFSMLTARGVDFSRVLDLYAGTGALGIEALSRGGGWCDFVERDRAAARAIATNLAALGLEGCSALHSYDAALAADRLSGPPYTLVLADPPYADERAATVLERLAVSRLVTADTILVWERSSRQPVPGSIGPFVLAGERKHGDSLILIFSQQSQEEPA